MVNVARPQKADDHAKLISMVLVCATEGDRELGRQAVAMVMKTIAGPIPKGHTPFAHTLARCAIVYDLCYESWTPRQRGDFQAHADKLTACPRIAMDNSYIQRPATKIWVKVRPLAGATA